MNQLKNYLILLCIIFCCLGKTNAQLGGIGGIGGTENDLTLHFDGVDDMVEIKKLTIVGTPVLTYSNYTVEFWFKPDDMDTPHGIMTWQEVVAVGELEQYRDNSIELSSNTIRHSWDGNHIDITVTNLSGQWHHYAVTYDGTTRSVYLDGVFQKSDELATHNLATNTFTFGKDVNDNFYKGELDEIRIWTEARTCTDINSNLNNELEGTETNLLLYQNFDGAYTGGGDNTFGLGYPADKAGNYTFANYNNFTMNGATSNLLTPTHNISGTSPIAAAEIDIQSNSTTIVSGGDTPSTDDNTDFGDVTLGNPKTVTYTIENFGQQDLVISDIIIEEIGGANSSAFTLSNHTFPITIAEADNTTFTLTFEPTTNGTGEVELIIETNDCDESEFIFSVQANGLGEPEINVKGNNTDIASGATAPSVDNDTDFGEVLRDNQTVSKTFTIENLGNTDLTLSGDPIITLSDNAGDFTVTTQPTTSTISASNSQTFTITFNPSDIGASSSTVNISSNDSDESLYTFTIQGTGLCNEADLPVLSENQTICSGESVNLSVISGELNNATHWQWYKGTCGGSPLNTGTSITVLPTETTTYFVRGEGDCTTSQTCQSVTVTVNPLPELTFDLVENICLDGTPINLSATPINGTFSGTGVSEGVFSPSIAGVGQHTLTYSYTNENNCSNSISKTIEVFAIPEVSITTNSPICQTGTLQLQETTADAVSWIWTGPNGFTSSERNPTIANIQIANEGTYTVTATNANGCSTTSSTDVDIWEGTLLTSNFLIANTVCTGDTVHFVEITDLADLTVDDVTFSWDFGDGTTSSEPYPEHVYKTVGTMLLQVEIHAGECINESITKEITVTSNCSDAVDVSIYPNPSDGNFRLAMTVENNKDKVKIMIVNSSGQIVREQLLDEKTDYEEWFKLEDDGIYIIHTITQYGRYTKKVVVY